MPFENWEIWGLALLVLLWLIGLWKAARLIITKSDGEGITLVVQEPDEIKSLIESMPLEPKEYTEEPEEEERGLFDGR